MASDSKPLLSVPVELHSSSCKDSSKVDKIITNNSQFTLPNASYEDLVNLQEDLVELNKVLSVVKSDSVKDSITEEINLISAKISGLLVPTTLNPNKEPLWTEVVKGKKNNKTPQNQGPFHIPVINNRYNLLPSNKKCEDSEIMPSSVVQNRKVPQKCVNKTCKKCQQKKNTVIILGDSHARGCASEVQHNLDHDYRTQGTVKPGANLETSKEHNLEVNKKRCSSDIGRNS